ncbi:MAG: hypothetical protein RL264_440 [Bacteroidota bacterium]|jgi:hypothetical protein
MKVNFKFKQMAFRKTRFYSIQAISSRRYVSKNQRGINKKQILITESLQLTEIGYRRLLSNDKCRKGINNRLIRCGD